MSQRQKQGWASTEFVGGAAGGVSQLWFRYGANLRPGQGAGVVLTPIFSFSCTHAPCSCTSHWSAGLAGDRLEGKWCNCQLLLLECTSSMNRISPRRKKEAPTYYCKIHHYFLGMLTQHSQDRFFCSWFLVQFLQSSYGCILSAVLAINQLSWELWLL